MQNEMYQKGMTVGRSKTGDSGRSVTIENQDEIQNTLKQIRNEDDSIKWLFIEYQSPEYDCLKLREKGEQVSDLIPLLTADNAGYAIIAVEDLYDDRVKTMRFAYITWVGENIPGIKKAKIGTFKTHVTQFLGHYNVEIFGEKQGDVSEEDIREKVLVTSGSKSRVTDKSGSKETTSSKSSVANAPSYTKSQHINIIDEETIRQQIAAIRDDNQPINWMLIGYQDKGTLQPYASGEGDITELRDHLKPTSVNYGFLRVSDQIDNSTTIKFIYISWVGENVSPLFKGRITSHKGAVEEMFDPYHTKMSGTESNDMTVERVNEKLKDLKK